MSENINKIFDNYNILSGSYFDELVEFGDGIFGLKSSTFNDIGWNYVFSNQSRIALSNVMIETIKSCYHPISPFLVFLPDQHVALNGEETEAFGDFGVWMSCSKRSFKAAEHHFSIRKIYKPNDIDIANLTSTFRSAYCNNQENQIGYNDLEEYYPQGYAKQLKVDERCWTFIIEQEGTIAGLASIVFDNTGKNAGLYNVAVSPKYRGAGIGTAVSSEATLFAFSKGAELCILQTESDTKVEEMYSTLGFQIDFNLQYIELS